MFQYTFVPLLSIILVHEVEYLINAKPNARDDKKDEKVLRTVNVNHEWAYSGETGPSNWAKFSPNCRGKYQSPIVLRSGANVVQNSTSFLQFSRSYDRNRKHMVLSNTGKTAMLDLSKDDHDIPIITVNGLQYYLFRMHFHWGLDDAGGCEHIIESDPYRSLEMHLVHTNKMARTLNKPKTVVLTSTFKVFNEDNYELFPITSTLKSIKYVNTAATLASKLAVSDFFPPHYRTSSLFYYYGSLTTPPCTEGVSWVIFKNAVAIGYSQLQEFRNLLKTEKGSSFPETIAPNIRPVQQSNGRQISMIVL